MQKEIIIIVAFQKNDRGFGYQGKLPWPNIPTDMKHFRNQTTCETVIMGRKTWESIPEEYRPLPDRKNIIVSTTFNPQDLPSGVVLATSLENAIQAAATQRVFLCGGLEIYKKALELNLVNTICETVLYPKKPLPCDRFFPEISERDWQTVHEGAIFLDKKSDIELQFITRTNKKNPSPGLGD